MCVNGRKCIPNNDEGQLDPHPTPSPHQLNLLPGRSAASAIQGYRLIQANPHSEAAGHAPRWEDNPTRYATAAPPAERRTRPTPAPPMSCTGSAQHPAGRPAPARRAGFPAVRRPPRQQAAGQPGGPTACATAPPSRSSASSAVWQHQLSNFIGTTSLCYLPDLHIQHQSVSSCSLFLCSKYIDNRQKRTSVL